MAALAADLRAIAEGGGSLRSMRSNAARLIVTAASARASVRRSTTRSDRPSRTATCRPAQRCELDDPLRDREAVAAGPLRVDRQRERPIDESRLQPRAGLDGVHE